jgi:mannosyltransferase OCH1-like enzyme
MIPNNLILTWKNNDIPQEIFTKVKSLNPTKEILFFTDTDIVEFLSKHYGQDYVKFFESIENGYNKGDFFRYCFLYENGGHYCDIDIEHIIPIDDYLQPEADFFSVISCLDYGHIFQALLYTVKKHPIIRQCIYDMFYYGANPPITSQYIGHTTTCMFKNIKSYLGKEPYHGFVKDAGVQLGAEKLKENRHICVYENLEVAYSRYQNYSRQNGFQA